MAESEETIGFRVGAIEGRLTAVDERLRAVDRIEERVGVLVDDVGSLARGLEAERQAAAQRRLARAESEAQDKRQGRRDLIAVAGSIIVAIIGALAVVVASGVGAGP